MEGIDSTWDDLLHESLSLSGGVLGSPESKDGFHAYDIDFVSHLAFADKNVSALWSRPKLTCSAVITLRCYSK
jgi:hypothetical protein